MLNIPRRLSLSKNSRASGAQPKAMSIFSVPGRLISHTDDIVHLGQKAVGSLVEFAQEYPKTSSVIAVAAAAGTLAFRRNFLQYADEMSLAAGGGSGLRESANFALARNATHIPDELSKGGEGRPVTFDEWNGMDAPTSDMESLFVSAADSTVTPGKGKESLEERVKNETKNLVSMGFPYIEIIG